jgi:hypothetical protein
MYDDLVYILGFCWGRHSQCQVFQYLLNTFVVSKWHLSGCTHDCLTCRNFNLLAQNGAYAPSDGVRISLSCNISISQFWPFLYSLVGDSSCWLTSVIMVLCKNLNLVIYMPEFCRLHLEFNSSSKGLIPHTFFCICQHLRQLKVMHWYGLDILCCSRWMA